MWYLIISMGHHFFFASNKLVKKYNAYKHVYWLSKCRLYMCNLLHNVSVKIRDGFNQTVTWQNSNILKMLFVSY